MSSDDNFVKKRVSKKAQKKEATKFRASVDKNTSLTMYQRDGGLFLIIKKDLLDYDLNIIASEAPIINQYLKTPDPFESMLVDIKIVEKEIAPINAAIQVFGESKEISLLSVKLVIGSNENDYVTIDETDLSTMDVEPTMQGLTDFIESNKDSVIGLCDRLFDHEKGNINVLEARIRDPAPGVSSIEIKLLSSLQQRGMAMQKYMKYAVLQRYIVIKAETLTDSILEFLKAIDIDWEMIFLRRELATDSWVEVECERNSINLKGYLTARYDALGFFDVNNITRLVVRNQLNFKIADKIADILNQVKIQRQELTGNNPDTDPLKKAEIVAAAKIACAYNGIKKEIEVEQDVSPDDIAYFEAEIIKM